MTNYEPNLFCFFQFLIFWQYPWFTTISTVLRRFLSESRKSASSFASFSIALRLLWTLVLLSSMFSSMSELVKISESLSDSSELLTDVFMFLILIQVHWVEIFSFLGWIMDHWKLRKLWIGSCGSRCAQGKAPPWPPSDTLTHLTFNSFFC